MTAARPTPIPTPFGSVDRGHKALVEVCRGLTGQANQHLGTDLKEVGAQVFSLWDAVLCAARPSIQWSAIASPVCPRSSAAPPVRLPASRWELRS